MEGEVSFLEEEPCSVAIYAKQGSKCKELWQVPMGESQNRPLGFGSKAKFSYANINFLFEKQLLA